MKSCRIVDTNGLRHDFEDAGNEIRASTVRLVQDRSQGGACCSFDKIENEVYEESRENFRGLEPDDSWHSVAAETLTDGVNWNVMAPLLLETARTYRKLETKKMSVTELEVESLLLRKKRALTTTREVGAELALPRNLEEKTSIETREKFGKDQGVCRDEERSQENKKQAFQLEFDCKTRKSRNSSHKLLPRPLLDLETKKMPPKPRDSTG